jgi:altronate dehydratase large subunit
MADNMDMNAGTIITGEATVQEIGKSLFEKIAKVASGKLTKAELLGHNEFAINRIGPTL